MTDRPMLFSAPMVRAIHAEAAAVRKLLDNPSDNSTILDTRLAFTPGSGYFGWSLTPAVKLVPGEIPP